MFRLNEIGIKIVACLVVCVLAFGWHSYDKHEAVREAKSATELRMATIYDKRMKAAQRASESVTEALRNTADKERDKKNETITSITRERDIALDRLRNRPTRPPTLPQDTSTGQACTARELYREDGEFLTREAARAQSIIVERDYYYQQYEEVRNKLNGNSK